MKHFNYAAAILLFSSLVSYTYAQKNTAYGDNTTNSKGNYNTSFGHHAGAHLKNGSFGNNFFGAHAGLVTSTGKNNVFFGTDVALDNTTGSENTCLGAFTGRKLKTASGNVFIGFEAGYWLTASNKLVIANGRNNNLITGDFTHKYVRLYGNLHLHKGLYFANSGNHNDGLPRTRVIEHWGMRFAAPTNKHVLSSKNAVLVGFDPNGEEYEDGNLLVKNSFSVGTTSPSTLFEINTGIKSNENALARIVGEYNPGLEIYSKTDENTRLRLSTNDGADRWEMNIAGNWDNRNLSFLYNSANRLTITKEGNVGIAETNPEYKLDVAGTVRADNFLSSTVSFPDYVFEEDYEVMPLSELEMFVNEYKHLPNMPAEKEVVEKGMNISDVTVKSVENIETIYLHLIEQGKQLENLTKKVKNLELENANLKKQLNQ